MQRISQLQTSILKPAPKSAKAIVANENGSGTIYMDGGANIRT